MYEGQLGHRTQNYLWPKNYEQSLCQPEWDTPFQWAFLLSSARLCPFPFLHSSFTFFSSKSIANWIWRSTTRVIYLTAAPSFWKWLREPLAKKICWPPPCFTSVGPFTFMGPFYGPFRFCVALLSVASLRLVSSGAVFDGVTLFSTQKKWWHFYSRQKWWPF